MYSSKPAFIYGFHAIDKAAALKILNQEDNFIASDNKYDWLGKGVYFWENSLSRAEKYAEIDKEREGSKIITPFVLGAVIDLGNCLDLLDHDHLKFVRYAYKDLKSDFDKEGWELPENLPSESGDFDFKKRELDCAVIRHAHKLACDKDKPFDTVRAAFFEGDSLYPGAGFQEKNHIQIAVLDANCIKGVFLPRENDSSQ